MRLLIAVITIFFVFIAFLVNSNVTISNPFIAYIFFILNFFIKYFPYLLIVFCLLFLYLFRSFLKKSHITLKIVFQNLVHTFSILLIGILISFFILISIALIHLNIFSLIINKNPNTLGVKTNLTDIKKSIENNNMPPKIITNDIKSGNEIIAIAKATSGLNHFYGNNILSGIPTFLILPVKNNKNIFFLDNTLIIKNLDNNDFKILSPVIGYQILKKYFPNRYIKSNPNIGILDSKSYKEFRKNDAKAKLSRVDIEINKTENGVSSLSAEIENDQRVIEENNNIKISILKNRDAEYNKCLSEGLYKSNVFVPKNSEEVCKSIIEKWDLEYKKIEDNEKKLKAKLIEDQAILKQYQFYNNYFKAQKQLIDLTKNSIPSELGIFEPANSIKIINLNNTKTPIIDFFQTLTHEYLHFTSFTPGKRLESSFFEESLTEYFARKAILSSLNQKANLGYPAPIKILEELSKRISDPELADIYFNKDQAELEKKINLVYGDNFYKNNIILFESLLYTSDPEQELKIANSIMKKIGGSQLQKKDIFSNSSN